VINSIIFYFCNNIYKKFTAARKCVIKLNINKQVHSSIAVLMQMNKYYFVFHFIEVNALKLKLLMSVRLLTLLTLLL